MHRRSASFRAFLLLMCTLFATVTLTAVSGGSPAPTPTGSPNVLIRGGAVPAGEPTRVIEPTTTPKGSPPPSPTVNTTLSLGNISSALTETVTLTATVSVNGAPGPKPPSGYVNFGVNGGSIGLANVDAHGVATKSYQLSGSLKPGVYNIQAIYNGDSTYKPSAATATLTVAATPTLEAKVDVPTANGTLGKTVNLVATVTPAGSSSKTPTGQVSFSVSGWTVGSANLDAHGVATLPYPLQKSMGGGSFGMEAVYGGDVNFKVALGTAYLHVGVASGTTASISFPSVSGYVGQIAQLTVAVSVVDPTGASKIPTGNVTFLVNSRKAGVVALNGQGVATLDYPITVSMKPGSYGLTAQYAGDANYPATATIANLKVNEPPGVGTKIEFPEQNCIVGGSVTMNATVQPVDPIAGSTPPTGAVEFSMSGFPIGNATIGANGVASLKYQPKSAVGSYAVQATYRGDANHTGSVAVTYLHIVAAAPAAIRHGSGPAGFGSSIKVDNQSGTAGQIVMLSAQVSAPKGAGLATGSVTFSVDGKDIGVATVDEQEMARALYAIDATMAIGKHTIKATYSGDSKHAGSEGSATLTISN